MLRKAMMFLYARLERPVRRADRFLRLAKKELGSAVPVRPSARLRMWRAGFLGESFVIYQLDRNEPSWYVTDFERHVRTPDLNGRYRVLLQDKLLFARTMRNFGAHEITTHGVIRKGWMHYTGGKKVDAADHLQVLLRTHQKLILKPVAGGGGANIRLLFREGDRLLLNERPLSPADLRKLVASMRDDLVSSYVEQSTEIAALYPRTVNTLRVLTMWDEERGEPFIAATVLRIGRADCYPVDNWTQGGLTADVELETGMLGKGVSHPGRSKDLTWHVEHPDTGARIEGFVLPRWPEIEARMLEVCRSLPFLLCVGWDLVLTADGFRILEGNHYPDLNLMQVHRPLLADARIARFYQTHGVVKRAVTKPAPRAARIPRNAGNGEPRTIEPNSSPGDSIGQSTGMVRRGGRIGN